MNSQPGHSDKVWSGTIPAEAFRHLLIDSRRLYAPANTLFFALSGQRRDGHQFIADLYKRGVRHFVISKDMDVSAYPDASFYHSQDTLATLQKIAADHRSRFNLPVIGITGSNGKTIVKEWLFQILHDRFQIVRSPKSYNSQIGVPLSVRGIEERHTLGIFEAGISQPGEMVKLEQIIRPDIGVLTNIGEAHSEGFLNTGQKLKEKLQLFRHAKIIIGREQDLMHLKEYISGFESAPEVLTWGPSSRNQLTVKLIEKHGDFTSITVCPGAAEASFTIPFTDDASIENSITCYFVALQLGIPAEELAGKMRNLQPVNMRLELKKAINQCTIINDSYSADLSSLEIALNFLDQQASNRKKTVILSDVIQSGQDDAALYDHILKDLQRHRVDRLIGIGPQITHAYKALASKEINIELFDSTEAYIHQFRSTQFRDEIILVKGARIFGFEQIVQMLEQKVHETVLEINLNALVHNVKLYQQQLLPSTKLMAMVKAFAYGSGGAEIAGILQFHKVDYLGVAYADEGIELRRAGIMLPIMVMNPDESAFESLVEYNLEPDLFSFGLLKAFERFLDKEGLQYYPVHLEIETGMNRLGFDLKDIPELATHLSGSSLLKVQSVFSHLASSEDPGQNEFTLQQFHRYQQATDTLKSSLAYPFIRHISNTGAIFRLPELQMDMVRLGIGMYGIDSAGQHQSELQPVATLKSTIAQIKLVKKGESVSYNRKAVMNRDSTIATVRIGYADGYTRKLGYGNGKMLINGTLAPVIGTVCMDMTMVDITDIPHVEEGDEVIIFGKDLPIQQVANWAGAIPYEIMTGISQRVKRLYFEE